MMMAIYFEQDGASGCVFSNLHVCCVVIFTRHAQPLHYQTGMSKPSLGGCLTITICQAKASASLPFMLASGALALAPRA